LLFANPFTLVSLDRASILRGEKLAEVVTERTSEFGTQLLSACIPLEVDTRRDSTGVAEDDNLTVTVEGVLVINGHSAVVEKDLGTAMMEKSCDSVQLEVSYIEKGVILWLTITVMQQIAKESGRTYCLNKSIVGKYDRPYWTKMASGTDNTTVSCCDARAVRRLCCIVRTHPSMRVS